MISKLQGNDNIKLFTHTDLDGVGCAIVGKLAFPNIDITYCDYHNVNDIISEFIANKGYENYDGIFITDISVNEKVAEDINNKFADKVSLIDHHGTAMWLKFKYGWADVRETDQGYKTSGTSMFFDFLYHEGKIGERYEVALSVFVETVRRYDTWDWKNIYDDLNAGRLNQLLYLVGRDLFFNSFMTKFTQSSTFKFSHGEWMNMFDKGDRLLLQVDELKKRSYIESKDRSMKPAQYKGHQFGVVFAEQYISELGNELSNLHPELKFIAIIDMSKSKVSLRTTHKDIDLGREIAKDFGGGGHPQASGFNYDATLTGNAIESIFKEEEKQKRSTLNKIIDILTKK